MDNIKQLMFHLFQNDPKGVKVFEYLTSRFYDKSLFNKDAYVTAYNTGQHDLILQIINMMANTNEGEQEDGQET